MNHWFKNTYLFILPGLLMAMTGVGVGDLATAGFTGAQLGVTVLWAVVLGGVFKYFLTEGIARWQLATNESLVSAVATRFKAAFILFLIVYFLPWCWFVGGAIINAAGVAGVEVFALAGINVSKIEAGIFHSVLIALLVLVGKQAVFNSVMSVLAVVLFITVFICALAVPVPVSDILKGLLLPSIPAQPEAFSWTIALMGGVGGTLTIVCYGYWLSISDRSGIQGLRSSRWDLAISYTFTCMFGIAMVIIGSVAVQEGKGLSLLLSISEYFSANIHPALGLCFLFGAWAAIVSSMLGVWQAVPFLFADAVNNLSGSENKRQLSKSKLEKTKAYIFGVLFLTVAPLLSLFMSFKEVQKLYSFIGAFFMPVLALTLLWLNNRVVDAEFKNPTWLNGILILVFGFFVFLGVFKFV